MAISADRPSKLRSTLRNDHLTYRLLSDAKMEASRAFGIAWHVPDAERERLAPFRIDLERASGETHHLLPVPSVFLLDADGIIRFVYSNPDYKVRIEPEQLVAAARRISREEPSQ